MSFTSENINYWESLLKLYSILLKTDKGYRKIVSTFTENKYLCQNTAVINWLSGHITLMEYIKSINMFDFSLGHLPND